MKAYLKKWWLFILILAMPVKSMAQEYKIWQFAPEQLPKIDGNATDWEAVPDSFVISIDRMKEDEGRYTSAKKSTLDVRVKVAWCAGINRLYFLYEAYDNYWRFSENSLNTEYLRW